MLKLYYYSVNHRNAAQRDKKILCRKYLVKHIFTAKIPFYLISRLHQNMTK